MVVPVLLFLGLCCLEFSRILGVDQYSATISRQLAQAAVRQCLAHVISNPDGPAVKSCLVNGVPNRPNRVSELFKFAESLSPRSELILSLYFKRRTLASGVAYYSRLAKFQSAVVGGQLTMVDAELNPPPAQFAFESKFSLNLADGFQYSPGRTAYALSTTIQNIPGVAPEDTVLGLAARQDIIVIAEAHMRYQLLIQWVRFLFGQQEARYDIAIF